MMPGRRCRTTRSQCSREVDPMSRIIRAVACLGLVAVGVSTPGAATAGQPSTQHRRVTHQARAFKDAIKFTPATVVDPILFGGEPGLNFDPATGTGKRSYVDWPVSSRTNIG